MSFKQQPLNQEDYAIKIITDLGRLESKEGSGKFARYALCECSQCKTHFRLRMGSTKAKQQTVCIDCSVSKHNISRTPLYAVWNGIHQRCYNPKRKDYPRYGGIGVTMCEEWKDDPFAFHTWCLANGWKPGLVVDKDIKCKELGISPAIYAPHTVSFITPLENAIEANGKQVDQYDLDGNLLNTFDSNTDAAVSLGKPRSSKSAIANAARGVTKTAFGFKWKYRE